MIHTSAPAKIILFGEHASRHGKPSIVFAIDQRMHVFLRPRSDSKITINSPDLGIQGAAYPCDEPKHVSGAIRAFLEATGKRGGFELTTKSEMKEGFGSSGASVVATLGALNEHFRTGFGRERIYELGCRTIQEVQGFGSGIDIASSTYGGLVRFVKGETPQPVRFRDFPIVIGNTRTKARSKPIIEAVESLEKKYPEIFSSIYDRIGDITARALKAFQQNDLETLGQLMNINHGFLYSAGVSSDILERLVFASRKAGCLGAKLSGAGIGDNMIALAAPGREQDIAAAISQAGGDPTVGRIDEGLRTENQ
jgi:mevalonate kinase